VFVVSVDHVPGSINVDHASGQWSRRWSRRFECVIWYFTR